MPDDESGSQARRSGAPLVVAAIVGTLSLVPLVNLIPGGHEMPLIGLAARDWMYGSMIVVGIGYIMALFSRTRMPYLWRPQVFARLVALWTERPVAATAV